MRNCLNLLTFYAFQDIVALLAIFEGNGGGYMSNELIRLKDCFMALPSGYSLRIE